MTEERARRHNSRPATHGPATRQPHTTHTTDAEEQRPASSRRRSPSAATSTTEPLKRRTTRRQSAPLDDLPAVGACQDLDTLRHLTPEEARHHVHQYLHTVMPAQQADDFEALAYRWELHLVELDHVYLVRQIDMNRRKVSRYRTALRKGAAFPPLIALGGDGLHSTEQVLLCDGYHRVTAMRDIGLHFAWIWLAVSVWSEPAPRQPELSVAGCASS